MRLVKVKTPLGRGREVAQIALDVGISDASIYQIHSFKENVDQDVVDVETSTPKAKKYVDAVMQAPFFDPQKFSLNIRQPRALILSEGIAELTRPLCEPATDIFEELWQFSHITYGFVGRVLIASAFLAYGLIQANLLLMIAGLMFLPFLPPMLAIGFGLWTKQWRLAAQGLFAFAVGCLLVFAGGVIVALLSSPPMRFHEFNSLPVSFLISVGVGIAAGLATADDVGRREMIGLAATAQITLLPSWLGISLVFGFSPVETSPPGQRLLTFIVNLATIVIASLITYAAIGMRRDVLTHLAENKSDGATGLMKTVKS